MRAQLAAFAFCLALPALAHAQYWSDVTDGYASGPEFAQSKALCKAVKGRQPPAADRPDAATRAALKGCSSEDLYYGVGRPADPAKARQCAFIEQAAPDQGLFAGDVMLMTVYANGRGAARNLDVAMSLACGIDGAPAEIDGRVKHLADIRAGKDNKPFDYCDDITSGLAEGYCAAHAAAEAEARRKAALAALTRGWTPAEQAAFATLQKAEEAFVEAHADKEVDMSGTARAAMSIAAEEEVRDDFVARIRALAAGKAKVYSAAQYQASDAALNAAYGKVMKQPEEDLGTVKLADIRAAQRVWLKYRDAFVAFAKVKWPAVSGDTVAGGLTDARIKLLEGGE